ncbi:hypothetical protein PUN28_013365 [Cardiocondyla obscurior]
MMPGDIAQLRRESKKKVSVCNQTNVSSMLLEEQKKMHTEHEENIELGLLYDKYLQTIMMDLIIKKKTEEKKKQIVTQLATVAQEVDRDMQKLIKIKTRERDIINLSLAQKEVDAQLIAVTRCNDDKTFKIVKDILFKLQSLLEPLDILQCNGLILPNTEDEWKKIQEMLTKCSNVLKRITSLIGSKGETYCAVNDKLKNFTKTNNEIQDLQEKLEKALCNLQILMLKNASISLTFNENKCDTLE